ncbi:MAG TPA: bifunctional 2-polyprenyl-6-hydroxyphenol methylase/3-demethylubiquinol 3-O-methyltransferase UbiG [Waddliaceae bacterium]
MEQKHRNKTVINNDFYDLLGEKWYTAFDHPVALLRAENEARAEWIGNEIDARFGEKVKILDVGCGAGLLSNQLSTQGHHVTGVDISKSSLKIAQRFDRTKKALYLYGNAYGLPFLENSFDVVCATDVLEHVENPYRLIQEASRVLRLEGLFFFHTFNRNFLSKLVVIKGVEWFVKNAPKNMHVYDLFIRPKELEKILLENRLEMQILKGLAPRVWSLPFWKMMITRTVPKDMKFVFTKSLSIGYCGLAIKRS